MKRVWNLTRVGVINAPTMLWLPFLVLSIAAAISFLIFAILPPKPDGGLMISGGLNAPLWYFIPLGIQAVNLLFPFSLALGATRREYALSCFLSALLSGVALSIVTTAGGALEGATGWGHRWYFFHLPWMWNDGWFGAFLLTAAITWLFYMLGFAFSILYKRFGTTALILIIGALILALVGLLWVVVASAGWANLFAWFNWFGPFSTAGSLAVLSIIVAAGAYWAILRLQVR